MGLHVRIGWNKEKRKLSRRWKNRLKDALEAWGLNTQKDARHAIGRAM